LRIFSHIILFLLLAVTVLDASAQRKSKRGEISYKEKQKFDRLYIDASKAKLLSDLEQSIKLYEACLKIDPSQPAPYYELGSLYMHFGENEAAIENSQKAAELEPTNYYYRLLYAEILKNNQRFDEVVKEYNNILVDFPEKVNVYFDLALIYILRKEYSKAIETYDELEGKTGPNEDIKLKKQFLYIQNDEIHKAAKEIEALIELQPNNIQYYLLLADMYNVNGLEEKALKAYKIAEEKFPEEAAVHLSLAEYFKSKGQINESLVHLKLAFEDPQLDIDLKVKTILLFFDLADRDPSYKKDIFELGQILLRTHPDDARVLTINGDISMNLNKPKEARNYFIRALEIDKSRFPIWSQILILEADLGIFDTLAIHSQQAIELFPNQPICYYFLGFSKSRLNEHKEAAESYRQGLNLIVGNDELKMQFYLGMADSYNEIKEFNLSDEAFDAVLKMDSNNTVALNNYSYYLSERNDRLDEALVMSEKSNNKEPDQATYLDTYAWIFYKLERYEEAKMWMIKAIKYGGSKNGVILEHMGDIYYKLEDVDEAVKYWKKAKAAGETSELIDKKIGEKKLYE